MQPTQNTARGRLQAYLVLHPQYVATPPHHYLTLQSGCQNRAKEKKIKSANVDFNVRNSNFEGCDVKVLCSSTSVVRICMKIYYCTQYKDMAVYIVSNVLDMLKNRELPLFFLSDLKTSLKKTQFESF